MLLEFDQQGDRRGRRHEWWEPAEIALSRECVVAPFGPVTLERGVVSGP